MNLLWRGSGSEVMWAESAWMIGTSPMGLAPLTRDLFQMSTRQGNIIVLDLKDIVVECT
jgi:hypothetical protein